MSAFFSVVPVPLASGPAASSTSGPLVFGPLAFLPAALAHLEDSPAILTDASSSCLHSEAGFEEGICYGCFVEQLALSGRGQPAPSFTKDFAAEADRSTSTLNSSASKASRRSGKVSFRDVVDVFETYHKEDYPARSMLAADLP